MKLITGIIFALGAAVAAGRERATADAAFAGGPLVTADENAPGLALREQWFTDDPADSLYRAARETLNKGDYRRAATLFRQVVDRYPQSSYVADALYYQAFALARLGTDKDLRQALAVLDEQRKRFPEAADGADVRTLVTRIPRSTRCCRWTPIARCRSSSRCWRAATPAPKYCAVRQSSWSPRSRRPRALIY